VIRVLWSALTLLHLMVIALALSPSAFAVQPNEIIRIGDSPRINLQAKHTAYFVEHESLDPAQIISDSSIQWQQIHSKTINIGMQTSPMWFRFELHNTMATKVRRLIEIRWNNFEEIALYERYGNQAADQYTLAEKGQKSSSQLFYINLEPGQSTELFLRIKCQNQIFLPIFIWQQEVFTTAHANLLNWYFLAFGALLSLTLYNLSLFIFTREKTYFYYTFYAISVIIYELGMTGIGSRYVWDTLPWMHKNGFALGVNLCFFSAALFFREFLEIKSYTKWITIAWYVIVGYWALGLLSLVFLGWFPSFALESSLITCICAVIGTIWLLALGSISARYYAVAWGTLIVFTMATLSMIAGFTPYSEITEYCQMAGFLAEMLLLSIALAARINRERLHREQQQQETLILQMEISRERENKIRAQEHILKLEKETNLDLEKRVQVRTQELHQAMRDLQLANKEMSKLSVTDSLTQVHNRRYFDDVLDREITRASRSQKPLALILIDIDHFKQFNDNYGHLVGDECLRTVALALQNGISRKSDLVARYGGEEFAVILPDTNAAEAFTVAEKIRTTIQSLEFTHQGIRVPISASLGIATVVPDQAFRPTGLIQLADSALYQAKDQGRNRCVAVGNSHKRAN